MKNFLSIFKIFVKLKIKELFIDLPIFLVKLISASLFVSIVLIVGMFLIGCIIFGLGVLHIQIFNYTYAFIKETKNWWDLYCITGIMDIIFFIILCLLSFLSIDKIKENWIIASGIFERNNK